MRVGLDSWARPSGVIINRAHLSRSVRLDRRQNFNGKSTYESLLQTFNRFTIPTCNLLVYSYKTCEPRIESRKWLKRKSLTVKICLINIGIWRWTSVNDKIDGLWKRSGRTCRHIYVQLVRWFLVICLGFAALAFSEDRPFELTFYLMTDISAWYSPRMYTNFSMRVFFAEN